MRLCIADEVLTFQGMCVCVHTYVNMVTQSAVLLPLSACSFSGKAQAFRLRKISPEISGPVCVYTPEHGGGVSLLLRNF